MPGRIPRRWSPWARSRPVGEQGASQTVAHKQAHGTMVQTLPQHILLAHNAQGRVVFVHNLQQIRSVV